MSKLPFLSLADGAAETASADGGGQAEATNAAASPSTSSADETQAEEMPVEATAAASGGASPVESGATNPESNSEAAGGEGTDGEKGEGQDSSSVLQLTGRVDFAEEQEEVVEVPAPRAAVAAAVESDNGSEDSAIKATAEQIAPGGAAEAELAPLAPVEAASEITPSANEITATVRSVDASGSAVPAVALTSNTATAPMQAPSDPLPASSSLPRVYPEPLPIPGFSPANHLEQPNSNPLPLIEPSTAVLPSPAASSSRVTIASALRTALATLTGSASPSPSDKEAAVLALQAGLHVLSAAEQAPKLKAAAAAEKPTSLIGALLHSPE